MWCTSIHSFTGPDATQAYVINELDNTITIMDIAEDGSMTIKKVVSTLPEGYDEPAPFDFYDAPSHSAEVMVSSDRLYVGVPRRPLHAGPLHGVRFTKAAPRGLRHYWVCSTRVTDIFNTYAQY